MAVTEHEPVKELPREEEMRDCDRNELRSFASTFNLQADGSVEKRELIRNLRRLREGGRVLKCPNDNCGRRWVYQGTGGNTCTSCGSCKTSVVIEHNTVDPRYTDGE